MYTEDKEEGHQWAEKSKPNLSLPPKDLHVFGWRRGGGGGRSNRSGQKSQAARLWTEGHGGVCVCVKAWGWLLCGGWGPCHLSALAERRPGQELGSTAGMPVLPSEGEDRGEQSRRMQRGGFIDTNMQTANHTPLLTHLSKTTAYTLAVAGNYSA